MVQMVVYRYNKCGDIYIVKYSVFAQVVELFLAKLMKFQVSLTLPLCPLCIAIAFP